MEQTTGICDGWPSAALFSDCGKYRYVLERRRPDFSADQPQRWVAFVGLNPSTATAEQDDPTVRRCRQFASDWGFTGFYMLNLFAYRSTDPQGLKGVADPVGPANDAVICATCHTVDRVVCCWGNHGRYLQRSEQFSELWEQVLAGDHQQQWPLRYMFGKTQINEPKHPLYLRRDTLLEDF